MGLIPLTHGGPDNGENFEYHWNGDYIHAHLLSDVGKKRLHNEDSCIFCAPQDMALLYDRGLLFAVADGMGGASAGELASRLALHTLIEEYYAEKTGVIPERLTESLQAANSRIFAEAEKNPEFRGMGTTVSAVVIHGSSAYVGQVGDSRVYLKRTERKIFQITDDHSLVAEQVRNGYISVQEARNHSLKNLITRAVGIKDTVDSDLFSLRLQEGDLILICSDGLSNMLDDNEISSVLTSESVQSAVRVLIGKALAKGGSDNITAVLLRVAKEPPYRELQEGADEVNVPAPGLFNRLKAVLRNPQAKNRE